MPASIADVKAAIGAILAYKFDGEGSRGVEDYTTSDSELYAAVKPVVAAIRLSRMALRALAGQANIGSTIWDGPRATLWGAKTVMRQSYNGAIRGRHGRLKPLMGQALG
jgi:hypothetical protein